jgi:hypothetical protein
VVIAIRQRRVSGSSERLRSISAGSCREWRNGHPRIFASCCPGRGATGAALPVGLESLDRYLKTQAGLDVRWKANAVFIVSEIGEPTHVLGYYTLCAMAISQGEVPEAARKHVPRYPLVSATLMGRLAVAKDSVWARSF